MVGQPAANLPVTVGCLATSLRHDGCQSGEYEWIIESKCPTSDPNVAVGGSIHEKTKSNGSAEEH